MEMIDTKPNKPQLNDGRYLDAVGEDPFTFHGNDTLLRCVAELSRLGKRHENGLRVDGNAFSIIADEILWHLGNHVEYYGLDKHAEVKINLGRISLEDYKRLEEGSLLEVADKAK